MIFKNEDFAPLVGPGCGAVLANLSKPSCIEYQLRPYNKMEPDAELRRRRELEIFSNPLRRTSCSWT